MTARCGSKMNSKKSSRTHAPRGNSAAEILGIVLNSPLGQEAASVLRSALDRVFGTRLGAQKYADLRDEASEAAENYDRMRGSDPYAILGVSPQDSQERIKRVYLSLQRIFHEGGSHPNPEMCKRVNAAYQKIIQMKGWKK